MSEIFKKSEIAQIIADAKAQKLSSLALSQQISNLFSKINNNKDIGLTGLRIAYDNSIALINALDLSLEEKQEQLNSIQKIQENKEIIHKSKKGFIAIDLDGTTVVQKLNNNLLYGLLHKRSDIRKSMIEYITVAQKAGYDIVILTARHEKVDQYVLEGIGVGEAKIKVGTLPTVDVIDRLNKAGIRVTQIMRTPRGYKGERMKELLQSYKESGVPNPKGILFDDQLAQIESVTKLKEKDLIAYDINSFKNLSDYVDLINSESNEPFNLEELEVNILEKIKFEEDFDFIDQQKYFAEVKAIKQILIDVALRKHEAEKYEYKPEIDWVNKAEIVLGWLIGKLQLQTITHSDIEYMSYTLFGQSNLQKIQCKTECEKAIKDLLEYTRRIPVLQDMKKTCKEYHEYLKGLQGKDESVEQKLNLVADLMSLLENADTNKAIISFHTKFEAEKHLFDNSHNANDFLNTIQSLLEKIPIIGKLFRSTETKFSDMVEDTSETYKIILRPMA